MTGLIMSRWEVLAAAAALLLLPRIQAPGARVRSVDPVASSGWVTAIANRRSKSRR